MTIVEYQHHLSVQVGNYALMAPILFLEWNGVQL